MKRIIKYITLPVVAIALLISLASCSTSNFYKTFKALGAEIEAENCFTELSLESFKAKKAAKDDFVLILVSSDTSTSTGPISKIQFECDNQNKKDVKFYVFDVKEGVTHAATTGKEYRETFGVKSLTSSLGFVALGIQDGNILFDTSYPNDYCDIFNITEEETTTDNINVHAVAQYVIENRISNN